MINILNILKIPLCIFLQIFIVGFFASFFLSTLQCQEYIKAPPRVVIAGELNPGIQDSAREIILIKDIFKCIIIADAMYKFLSNYMYVINSNPYYLCSHALSSCRRI